MCPVIGNLVKSSYDVLDPLTTHAPTSLFPTPFPMGLYEHALELQAPLGNLIAGIVGEPTKNIHELLEDFAKKDAFMSRLI